MTLLPPPQLLPYQDPEDPAIRGTAAAGYGHLSMASLPWHLKEKQEEGGVCGVKASSTRRVLTLEEDVHGSEPMRLYTKRNLARTWRKALGYRLYRSKARREWEIGWALVRRGFLTGRPVLVAERRVLGAVSENYLVTEAIPAECTLHDHLERAVRERGEDPVPLFPPLARFVHELHAARFYHDDLSADHIWVDTSGGETRFGLIDLDQSRFVRRIGERQVLMNLFQILRSIRRRLLTPEQRLALLAAFHGDRWESSKDDVIRRIRGLQRAKGSEGALG